MRRRESDAEEEIEEIVPVAVTLRNAFAPKHQLTRTTTAATPTSSSSTSVKIDSRTTSSKDINIDTTRSESDTIALADTDAEEDAENDVGNSSSSLPSSYLYKYSYHQYGYQYQQYSDSSSRHGHAHSQDEHSNLPLEMELSVPHSLLVELKHSYQHWKRMKDKISDRFGLGKMDHESINSGKNDTNADGDIHRLVSICTLVISDSYSSSRSHSQLHERNSTFAGGVGTANHPLWDHIHERLDDLYNEVIAPAQYQDQDQHQDQHQNQHHHEQTQRERERIWTDIRNCMRIQCKAILISNTRVNIDAHSHANTHHANTNTHTNGTHMHSTVETTRTEIILTSASLNPKKLVILPINPNNNNSNSTSEAEEPSMLGVSKYTNAIPHALPRNSLMVHFSDGSTRVLPTLFSFLVKRGVISGFEQEQDKDKDKDGNMSASGNSNAGSRNGSIHDVQVDKFEKRFDDDIFNMLTDSSSLQNGHGHGNGKGNGRAVKLNLGSHTPPIIGNGSGRANGNGIGNGNVVNGNGNANATVRGSFTEAFNSLSMHNSMANSMTTPSKDGNILLKSMELSDDDAESDESENVHVRASANAHAHGNRPINARAKGDSFEAALTGDHSHSHRTAVAVSEERDRDSCDVIKRIQDTDEEIEMLQRILDEEEEGLKKEKETQQVVSACVLISLL